LSRGQPCDITGIRDYRMLDECGGIQWPWAEESAGGIGLAAQSVDLNPKHQETKPEVERRLFADGVFHHPDGRARFLFESPREVAEPADAAYPFVLLTGRGTSAQWHTQTRTGKSAVLRQLYPGNLYAEIHPRDA